MYPASTRRLFAEKQQYTMKVKLQKYKKKKNEKATYETLLTSMTLCRAVKTVTYLTLLFISKRTEQNW